MSQNLRISKWICSDTYKSFVFGYVKMIAEEKNGECSGISKIKKWIKKKEIVTINFSTV